MAARERAAADEDELANVPWTPAGDGAVTEAAKAARSGNPYLSPQYHRLRGRRGPAKATGGLSHSMLTGHILAEQVP